ncbi:cupin [Paenarthrobacter sp. NPDC089675]|uniref:cupin n=1 Tax=Paenarthrobacter sp. NPDC089675 TaxID=3364376 RepID=UPI0037FBA767
MAKPEFEFTPVSSVEFAPCNPHIEGLSEAILARDSDNDSVTRILKFEPGTDTSPNGVLTHDFWEEVFIFEGSFVDQRLGKTFKAGDWATPSAGHGARPVGFGKRRQDVRSPLLHGFTRRPEQLT